MRYSLFFVFFLTLLFSCRVVQPSEQRVVTVVEFGADPTGRKDSSQAFKKALELSAHKVVVPAGIYLLKHTVEINRKHLFLEAGVSIKNSKEGDNNSPLFWLKGIHTILEGENKSVRIKSHSKGKSSIIRIGHKDNEEINRNHLYCEVKNLTVEGSGRNNKGTGIHFFNSQETGDKMTTSYFHTLFNLNIENLNTGIHLEKFSNANSISNIIFNRVGAEESGCAVWIDGAMENRIYDFFHHHSEDALSFRVTRNEDKNPSYNIIQAGICEQGGKAARCLEMKSGAHNIIEINCNVLKGNILPDDFKAKKNIILKKTGN